MVVEVVVVAEMDFSLIYLEISFRLGKNEIN